ncbi:Annexin A8 [Manis pentadactyla]|nr:Annexin A8 [Manis pentadactyla]
MSVLGVTGSHQNAMLGSGSLTHYCGNAIRCLPLTPVRTPADTAACRCLLPLTPTSLPSAARRPTPPIPDFCRRQQGPSLPGTGLLRSHAGLASVQQPQLIVRQFKELAIHIQLCAEVGEQIWKPKAVDVPHNFLHNWTHLLEADLGQLESPSNSCVSIGALAQPPLHLPGNCSQDGNACEGFSKLYPLVLALQDSGGEQDGVKGRRLADEQSVGEEDKLGTLSDVVQRHIPKTQVSTQLPTSMKPLDMADKTHLRHACAQQGHCLASEVQVSCRSHERDWSWTSSTASSTRAGRTGGLTVWAPKAWGNGQSRSGTNKQAIIDVLMKKSNAQRQQIAKSFKAQFSKVLTETLKSELSGRFKRLIMALMYPPYRYRAKELHDAVKDLGTKEGVVIEILASWTKNQLQEIMKAYEEDYRASLEEDFQTPGTRDDVSSFVDLGLALHDVQCQDLYAAGEKIRGTGEMKFITILCTCSATHLMRVFEEYEKIANKSIEDSIKSETHGSLEEAMLTVGDLAAQVTGWPWVNHDLPLPLCLLSISPHSQLCSLGSGLPMDTWLDTPRYSLGFKAKAAPSDYHMCFFD